jgi:hypothetical protein
MPVDRGVIDAQLREIGEGERWWERREFRELPYILYADERIQGITLGKLLGPRRPRLRPAGRWLFVATDQRLICLKHERFARKQVDIARGQITRVHRSNRLRSYQITVETPERKYRLRIPKADAFRFAGALAPLIRDSPVRRLGPELEPLSWIPGITTVAALPGFAGIVSRVAMLSPPDYVTRDHVERLETTVERLQNDVERLQQQVTFLENLLQRRAEEAALPQASADA